MTQPNIEVEIVAIGRDGSGLGRLPAREVGGVEEWIAVPEALVGESVRVTSIRRSRGGGISRAMSHDWLRRHPALREPPCSSHVHGQGHCTGCPLMIVDEQAGLEIRLASIRARLGLEVDRVVAAPSPLGYRHSAKRIVDGFAGQLRLGSYRQGTHKVASMEGCLVDHPRIAAVWDELTREGNALRIAPYDERSHRGDLRYAWARCNDEQVMLTLVTASRESRVQELASRLELPSGIWWAVQHSSGNDQRGVDPQLIAGQGELDLELDPGHRVRVGPLGFVQPNPVVAKLAYETLLEGLWPMRPGEQALDLFAGAGATTSMLRARGFVVTPNESYPESAAALGVEPMTALACVSVHGRSDERATVVIANPPRAGLGAELCAALIALRPRALRIMSCHADTLHADLTTLVQSGAFRRDSLVALDTLPMTLHLELVASLSAVEPGAV